MERSVFLAPALFALAVTAAQPQAAPASGQAPPVITATTRLVQVSVIAKENGAPVPGLKAEDFTVLADGRPQKISFFSVESTSLPPAATTPLPPNTFTNILAARGQAVNAITVVLLDLVNTRMVDRMYARQQLIKYLEEIQPEDRIGVYVFSGRLRVLHDYTEDMSVFRQKLADAKTRLINVSGTETPGAMDREQSEFDATFLGRGTTLEEREFYLRNRVMGTLAVFKFIANHLERVPGRKNLIWLSDAFPTIFGYANLQQMGEDYTAEVDATVRALSQANVAVYPIDARGLTPARGYDASRNPRTGAPSVVPGTGPPASRPVAAPRSAGVGARESAAHATMQELAERTGGHAYYDTNALAKAIHEAVADSALTYTIGFYPVDEKGDREFHKIKIQTARHHVTLHYRGGYLDVPRASPDERQRLLQLHDAVFSPLDATELGLTVRVARSPTPADASAAPSSGAPAIDLLLTVKADGVLMKPEGDRYVGGLDVLIVQLDSRGHRIEGPADTHDSIELKMLGETYKKFTTDGLPLRKTVAPSTRAESLRIVVRDAGSGMIGSLTAPLKGI